jgi:hypothetical protein
LASLLGAAMAETSRADFERPFGLGAAPRPGMDAATASTGAVHYNGIVDIARLVPAATQALGEKTRRSILVTPRSDREERLP